MERLLIREGRQVGTQVRKGKERGRKREAGDEGEVIN